MVSAAERGQVLRAIITKKKTKKKQPHRWWQWRRLAAADCICVAGSNYHVWAARDSLSSLAERKRRNPVEQHMYSYAYSTDKRSD